MIQQFLSYVYTQENWKHMSAQKPVYKHSQQYCS